MLTQNPTLKRTLIVWAPPLLLILVSAILQAADWVVLLRYDRHLIEAGQIWRLLTGHLVHLGWSHWLLNSLGLLIIWALLEPEQQNWRSLVLLLACCLLTGIGLFLFSPQVGWYVGLSGALHGLLVAGMLRLWPRQPVFATVVLLVLLAKLVWEQVYGPMPHSVRAAGGPVVVDAHTWGALAGVLIELPRLIYIRLRDLGTGD